MTNRRDRDPVQDLRSRLATAIPAPECELDFDSPWHLLVATILSAQSTDRTVNQVTPDLFRRFPTPAALADANQEDVEQVIRRTGFFRNKARAIREASRLLVRDHDGEVPASLEQLVKLPGVARKTANVVLGTAYGIPSGVVVDTHAARVAQRLGLTSHKKPDKVEMDLREVFPRSEWVDTGHRLVLHGRYVCTARDPRCDRCPLRELCPSGADEPAGTWKQRARWEQRRIESRGEAGD